MGGAFGVCFDAALSTSVCCCKATKGCASAIVTVPAGLSTGLIFGVFGAIIAPVPVVADLVCPKPLDQHMPEKLSEEMVKEIEYRTRMSL